MATRDTVERPLAGTMTGTRHVQRDETKAAFKTTEFIAFIATVVGVLVAAAQADNFDAPRAWTLVAAVAIGYMVSRGLAKSGSAHRDRDDG